MTLERNRKIVITKDVIDFESKIKSMNNYILSHAYTYSSWLDIQD